MEFCGPAGAHGYRHERPRHDCCVLRELFILSRGRVEEAEAVGGDFFHGILG